MIQIWGRGGVATVPTSQMIQLVVLQKDGDAHRARLVRLVGKFKQRRF
jgi:hypothetical protein